MIIRRTRPPRLSLFVFTVLQSVNSLSKFFCSSLSRYILIKSSFYKASETLVSPHRPSGIVRSTLDLKLPNTSGGLEEKVKRYDVCFNQVGDVQCPLTKERGHGNGESTQDEPKMRTSDEWTQ